MPELTRYLSRLCWLLQQGEPVADVALYVPNEDLFATMGRAQGGSLDSWREANRQIPKTIPAKIRTAGLDYDLIDDEALVVTAPEHYRVIIIVSGSTIPETTAVWLDHAHASGGTVLTIDSATELTDALVAAVAPDLDISPATPDIGFVHRRTRDADVYVVINTGPKARTFALAARTRRRSFEQWDAMSGHVLRSGTAPESIELTLHPYEATVIVWSDQPVTQISAETRTGHRLALNGPWRVAYGEEPARPVELPHIWENERGREHYSGAASYITTIELDGVDGQACIDFGDCEVLDGGATEHDLVGPSYRVAVRGPVGEVARVRVNGIDCGLAWAPPYRVQITNALRSGTNKIEIIVYNTAANALAADRHMTRLAAESEARYGRRFRMQDLDRAMDSVQSGFATRTDDRVS